MKTRVQRRYMGSAPVSVRLCDVAGLRSVLVLALLTAVGCGGAPFSGYEFAQADGGTSSEAASLETAVVDRKVTPEAGQETGIEHDAAANDADAAVLEPDAAPEVDGGSSDGNPDTCATGEVRCGAGEQPQMCVTDIWLNNGAACSVACVNGACAACLPGTRRCADGTRTKTCDETGSWVLDPPCASGACLNLTSGTAYPSACAATCGVSPDCPSAQYSKCCTADGKCECLVVGP